MNDTVTKERFVIRRAESGFILEWIAEGRSQFCGADRVWEDDSNAVRVPFPKFAGAEWYRGEWAI